ncbi:succinyl-diaminopimelate desuccinylase [Isoalcanivorax beigongshangi]|uniref:Succinyl-diaminopimelate desuccinylase n=1 Tax=Isoalcanivorax beigongshangi TaxID=3238810 RepID=A0ABV4AF49_9GAMM
MSLTDRVLAHASALIARPSVTPDDQGCQQWLTARLQALGFHCESMRIEDVDNLWAVRGDQGPLLVFAGHTDVVPSGPEAAWQSPPFAPQVRDGLLYGRGAADMKGSIAAFLVALEEFLAEQPQPSGRIGLLITSDEEGPALHGTRAVIERLQQRGEQIDWCLVGEPSSSARVGDVIKHGRRGSLSARLTVYGVQGHVAYPQLADNPIHRIAPALAALAAEVWDHGNDAFPPTTFQVSNLHGGTGATNVIPGDCVADINFRFSTVVTAAQLQHRTEALIAPWLDDYQLDWTLSGEPFLTAQGALVEAAQQAVHQITGRWPQLSTSGGTSDGRFIAPTGAQVVELGPVNATIHKVDECTSVAELGQLAAIYHALLANLLDA